MKNILNRIFAIVFVFCAFAFTVYAEGSKQLVQYGGYRPYTERYNSATAGEDRLTEIYVFANQGETIYFGTSVRKGLADGQNIDIVVIAPDGTKTTYDVDNNATATSNSVGFIGNCAQEAAGPQINGSTTGYNPFVITNSMSGKYTFKFYSSSLSGNNPKPHLANDDAAFNTAAQNGGSVAAWDVSVQNKSGVIESGRAYTYKLFLNMGNNMNKAGVLKSKMYAVTTDGYYYQIDFNGMDPYGFVFFANNRGMLNTKDPSNDISLYHSVRSNNNQLSDLVAHDIQLNNIAYNSLEDITYPLFFDYPSNDAVASLGIGNADQSPSAIHNFSFKGNTITGQPALSDNKGYVGAGGEFSFEIPVTTATSFEIQLNFGTDNIVTLSNALHVGKNTVSWDGKDAKGKIVPAGMYDQTQISVKLKGGEVHFPMLDVENNYDGIKIMRLTGSDTDNKSVVYYNNSAANIGDTTNGWTINNWVEADKQDHSVVGVDTATTGAMAYKSRLGDQTALDIWAYYSISASIDPYSFELVNPSVNITVNKVWDHGSNLSIPPAAVTAKLLADGVVVAGPETFTDTYTWTNQPIYNATGTLISYSIEESSILGYVASQKISGDYTTGYNIELKNTFTGNLTKIIVKKEWNVPQDTTLPSELKVIVNGTDGSTSSSKELILNNENNWEVSISGEDVKTDFWYTAIETIPIGFIQESSNATLSEENKTLTFTFTNKAVTNVSFEKNWLDDNNAESTRPASIDVQLFSGVPGSGIAVGNPITITDADNWRHTWNNLPLSGDITDYYVDEVGATVDYEKANGPVFDTTKNAWTVTNSLLTQITVHKEWDITGTDKRPETLNVQLLADGTNIKDFVLDSASRWVHTWVNLPKYNLNGSEIVYSVTETIPSGYKAEPVEENDGVFTLKNVYSDHNVSLEATKLLNGQPASEPFNFTSTLTSINGTEVDRSTDLSAYVTIDDANAYVQTATNGTDGNVKFGNMVFHKGGTYKFQIEETVKEGYICDSAKYIAEIKIGETQSDVSIVYSKDGIAVDKVQFLNYNYSTIQLSAIKTLNGGTLKADMFTFNAKQITGAQLGKDANGNTVMYTNVAKNDVNGKVTFDAIKNCHPGAYTFEISETAIEGYVCSTAVYTVTANVKEDGTVAYSYSAKNLSAGEVAPTESTDVSLSFVNTVKINPQPNPQSQPTSGNNSTIPGTGDNTNLTLLYLSLTLSGIIGICLLYKLLIKKRNN